MSHATDRNIKEKKTIECQSYGNIQQIRTGSLISNPLPVNGSVKKPSISSAWLKMPCTQLTIGAFLLQELLAVTYDRRNSCNLKTQLLHCTRKRKRHDYINTYDLSVKKTRRNLTLGLISSCFASPYKYCLSDRHRTSPNGWMPGLTGVPCLIC